MITAAGLAQSFYSPQAGFTRKEAVGKVNSHWSCLWIETHMGYQSSYRTPCQLYSPINKKPTAVSGYRPQLAHALRRRRKTTSPLTPETGKCSTQGTFRLNEYSTDGEQDSSCLGHLVWVLGQVRPPSPPYTPPQLPNSR